MWIHSETRTSHDRNIQSKPTNTLLPNRYQLLEPTSGNFELVSENIQNTDALRSPGDGNELHKNRNRLTYQNTGTTKPLVGLINTQKGKQIFRGLLSSLVPNYLVKLLYHQKVKETFLLIFTDSIRIRIRELNSFIKNSKTKMVSFPGAISTEIST